MNKDADPSSCQQRAANVRLKKRDATKRQTNRICAEN